MRSAPAAAQASSRQDAFPSSGPKGLVQTAQLVKIYRTMLPKVKSHRYKRRSSEKARMRNAVCSAQQSDVEGEVAFVVCSRSGLCQESVRPVRALRSAPYPNLT